jgi:hypothetical protein
VPVVGQTSIADGAIALIGTFRARIRSRFRARFFSMIWDVPFPTRFPTSFFWSPTPARSRYPYGCCHAGLINTCERARSAFPKRPIDAVIGGFHLAGVSCERLEATAAYLEGAGVRLVVPAIVPVRRRRLGLSLGSARRSRPFRAEKSFRTIGKSARILTDEGLARVGSHRDHIRRYLIYA